MGGDEGEHAGLRVEKRGGEADEGDLKWERVKLLKNDKPIKNENFGIKTHKKTKKTHIFASNFVRSN